MENKTKDRKAYGREYYFKHKERKREAKSAYMKEYHKKNREKILAYIKEWHRKNKDNPEYKAKQKEYRRKAYLKLKESRSRRGSPEHKFKISEQAKKRWAEGRYDNKKERTK
jgi:hypothetical protein